MLEIAGICLYCIAVGMLLEFYIQRRSMRRHPDYWIKWIKEHAFSRDEMT